MYNLPKEVNVQQLTMQAENYEERTLPKAKKCLNCDEDLSEEEIENCGEFCFICFQHLEDGNPLPDKEL